ncbi:AfsR/SARP family transcriptional regulator [Frankia sp. QA3]|uniref:AfsR/SARP family transcriptional regulator n=1 Tax=Frankia sp. QA3 TaxID=710111 RepID=UPI000269C5E5|nr:AfsR/SARP family transcriptional regulator [Frankia sp. QA3]EIV93543.1 DNA-binding transcriptional activator of the SARP family [Frankia sp. QA3]
MLEFNVLGELEVIGGGRDLAPSAPRVKTVLALLALNVNRVVSTETLAEELWDDLPPRSAATTLQTYIYQLRRILGGTVGGGAQGCDIVTRRPGYMLRTAGVRVDAAIFLDMVGEGRNLWKEERVDEAAHRLRQALELWRGPALADVRSGPRLRIHVAHLSEVRLRALELRVHAYARLGRHRELIPELRSLVAEHRLNESFHAQLIDSLSSAGRRAEALQAYQDLRHMLKTELGLDPTPEVQRLQTEVLSGVRGGTLSSLLRAG